MSAIADDLRSALLRRYGPQPWRRYIAEAVVMLMLGLGVAFSPTAVVFVADYIGATWKSSTDLFSVLMADKTVLVAATFALAIPVERASTNLIGGEASRYIDIVVLCTAVLLIFLGLGLTADAQTFAGMSAARYDSLTEEGLLRIERARNVNLAVALSLPPLSLLTVFSRVSRR